jgi:DNA-binding IclR family transcriptional regulator
MAGLDVIEVLGDEPTGLSLTVLARKIEVDKGNLHRMLGSLIDRGYVERDEQTKRYSLTPAIVSLAGNLIRNMDLVNQARPFMRELKEESGESVHLAHRTSGGGVYLAQDRQANRVTVATEIGGQPVIHCTATGKALYCLASHDELESVVDPEFTKYTSHTLQSMDQLGVDLDLVVVRGWALDDQEFTEGVRCVAAPVFDLFDHVVACIGISGPAERMSPEHAEAVGALVRATSRKLTITLGGSTVFYDRAEETYPILP